MESRIKNVLEELFLFEFNDDITRESDLFKLGVIDSYGYIKLIKYLEGSFGIKFTEDEILSNVFVSLSSLSDCISCKA